MLSCAVLIIYLGGVMLLGQAKGLSWRTTPVFWVGILDSPMWLQALCALTILAGTMLIYFIPGVFIAGAFAGQNDSRLSIWIKGFLINYFFYYFSSTFYKLTFQQEFSRQAMTAFCLVFIFTAPLIALFTRKDALKYQPPPPFSRSDFMHAALFLAMLIFIFSVCWKNILLMHFGVDGDGVEQFWLAQSVRSMTLPTSFRELFTLIPQFSFAPSIYLNMFALVLFGKAEFIIKIEIIVAFICMGFILKGLIEVLRGGQKLSLIESMPLLLYLVIFFLIICFRAAYFSPTELAKSNETLQLALFLCGFYFLLKNNGSSDMFAAVLFILAGMVRYNGLLMITCFLVLFSFLFRRYRCLLIYLSGLALLIAVLNLLLLHSAFGFREMATHLFRDLVDLGTIRESLDLRFTVNYLWNFFVFTAGMALFLVLGLRKRYIALMTLTTALYLLLPLKSIRVPAHFFLPVIMFPLIAFYLVDLKYRKTISAVVIIWELICLSYVYPDQESLRATDFESAMSKICLNTNQLFSANKRSRIAEEILRIGVDERAIMYYADLLPEEGKKYLLFFGAVSPASGDYDICWREMDFNGYVLRGSVRSEFIASRTSMRQDYYRGNKTYVIYRRKY